MASERSNIEDQLLVMDAQDGDAKAMEKLVRRWQKRLWQHAFRMTGDNQAAWDVTQQSWLGIIKGLRKLNDPANFRAWVYRITTNKSIDWIKKRKATKQISLEESQVHQHQGQQEQKDIGLRELLEQLDMRKKAVLSLYYFEQLSISEISIALKIPKGTVKSRLHKAREELKKLWQEHFE
ncbi:MAG: RNA polymerase sigma factor [Phycisphaerae bacterium]|nr:RNA polymerase sigma factor [Phycisphaerae bacterium]